MDFEFNIPLFLLFLWERPALVSGWFEANGTLIGAITMSIIGMAAARHYLKEGKFRFPLDTVKAKPWRTTVMVAVALLALNKYLTFLSAAATTIGVLVALDNNRKSHAREERRQQRQEFAARTFFARDLVEIQDYARRVSQLIGFLYDAPAELRSEAATDLEFPPIPATAPVTIKEMILGTDNKVVLKRCALMQRYIQLIQLEHDSLVILFTEKKADHQMMRCVALHATATSLLDFAREKVEHEFFLVNWEEARKSANDMLALDCAEFAEYFHQECERVDDVEHSALYPSYKHS